MLIRSFAALTMISAFAAGCGGVSDETSTEAPAEAETTQIAEMDLLQEKLGAFDKDLADGRYGLVDEVLVQHKGETVFHFTYDRKYAEIVDLTDVENEPFSYAHPDWHPYYRDTDLHTIQSITKSVTSVLIGIAEYEGLLPKVEEALLFDHIDDKYVKRLDDAGWSAMTIADLLAMRANIEWDEENYESNENDAIILEQEQEDWVQYVLEKPLIGEPGGAWYYNSGATQLLSAVIEHTTGMSASEYAEARLFNRLGITDHYWKESPIGLNDTLGGLYVKSTDLAKFCTLMMSRGLWNDERIIPEDFVARSIAQSSTLDPSSRYAGYGYKWWLGYKGFGPDNFYGSGYGGQALNCAPDEDLTIVLYSWNLPVLGQPDLIRNSNDVITEIHAVIENEIMPLLATAE